MKHFPIDKFFSNWVNFIEKMLNINCLRVNERNLDSYIGRDMFFPFFTKD